MELKPSLGLGFRQPYCLEVIGTWLSHVGSSMNISPALPPNILSTVLQYLVWALTGVLHFISL